MSKKNTVDYLEFSDKELNDKAKTLIKNIIPFDIKIKAKNDSQRELIRSIKNNEITICSGKAGTGKSFVALGIAISILKRVGNNFRKIYLVKSVTALKGEELGFLKGPLEDKIEPFMWSFLLNIEKLIPETNIRSLFESEIIKHFPLAFARGTTLDNSIIIIDEAQNISIDNIQTIMTRIGENSKIIILGDSNQIDLKNKRESSLVPILNMFEDVDKIGTVKMDDNDVNVRNPIIDIIDKKFKEFYEKK